MASNAASSELYTLAFPLNFISLRFAILTTAPSGAKVPLRIFSVPSLLSGSSMFLTILPASTSRVNCTDERFSVIVFPVTVSVSPLRTPMPSNFWRISWTPPILSRSAMAYFPPGRMSAMYGVRFLILSKSLI